MRPLVICLVMLASSWAFCQSPRISQAEWFIGDDPGEGLGVPLIVADDAWGEALARIAGTLPTTTLGPATLSVRVKGANGYWGSLFRTAIIVSPATVARPLVVQQGEFFFDSDPGEGNGVPLLAFDGDWNNALETGLTSVTSPSEGSHVLYVRMRGADGTWSNAYKTVLHASPSVPLRSITLQAAEYYFDTDPGEGNATPLLALDGDFDRALEQALASANLDDQGSHVLGVRVRGSDNSWSATFRSVVHVGPELIARAIRVQQGEFFFDSDPG
jgi:hypothetical protein